jgi:undecaprenyl phosphate-alpha-L-ara4N flippase subunit ArnE
VTFVEWLQLIIVVALGTLAQLSLKYALDRGSTFSLQFLLKSRWFWVWFFCYALSTVLWLFALRTVPLSQAFPILGLQFALVPIASKWILRESMFGQQWLGVVAIVLGVALVGRG